MNKNDVEKLLELPVKESQSSVTCETITSVFKSIPVTVATVSAQKPTSNKPFSMEDLYKDVPVYGKKDQLVAAKAIKKTGKSVGASVEAIEQQYKVLADDMEKMHDELFKSWTYFSKSTVNPNDSADSSKFNPYGTEAGFIDSGAAPIFGESVPENIDPSANLMEFKFGPEKMKK